MAGEPCPCADGFFCGDARCFARMPPGTPCRPLSQQGDILFCAAGTYCHEDTMVCAVPQPLGAPCPGRTLCAAGAVCEQGNCVKAPSPAPGPCAADPR